MIPSEPAAAPIANAVVLPLYFISGVFIPSEVLPETLRRLGDIFPISHLYQALVPAFVSEDGPGIAAGHLLVVLAWAVAGLAVASMAFRWSPRSRRG